MPLKTTPSVKSSGIPQGNSSKHAGQGNGTLHAAAFGLAEQLHSHSPDEVLGATQQASLTRGVAMASLLTIALMAVLTVGPFLLGSAPRKKKGGKPAVAAASQIKESPTQDAAPANAAADESANAQTSAGGNRNVSEKTMKRLGVNDVKQSDPKKNPLEDSVEDLLKDIK